MSEVTIDRSNDYWPTPILPVVPLIQHLPHSFTYIEPCAGMFHIVDHITTLTKGEGECLETYDAFPQHDDIVKKDGRDLTVKDLYGADYIITNPPWTRTKQSGYLMHALIENFSDLAPTWLLFDSNWANIQAIGRVKWVEGSAHTSTKDASWYLFDANKNKPTEFYGRAPKESNQ
jgi:hypothetical protein